MAAVNSLLFAFNRGLVSRLALARTDIKKLALAATIMTNWMPRSLGSMMLRPGLKFLGHTLNDALAKFIPFIKAASDTAAIELTDLRMRVWVSDALVTRPAVTSAVTNGTFTANIVGWTDASETGGVTQWVVGGYAGLTGTGLNRAKLRQTVTTVETGTLHSLLIRIARGLVTIRVGSSDGAQDYVAETDLQFGFHSLAFTPTGNFHIELSAIRIYQALVDSIVVDSGGGALSLQTMIGAGNLSLLRWDQSADVIFVGCDGITPMRIERRPNQSWSIVHYLPEKGPFRLTNITPTTITPSGLTGDITLTASKAIFTTDLAGTSTGNAGALFRLVSSGQEVTADLAGNDQFTAAILVTGIGHNRDLTIDISGTFSGGLHLQRSFAAPGTWANVKHQGRSSPTTRTYNDGLDNQIVYYRMGFAAPDYNSGTATVTLSTPTGAITGMVRVTAFQSETVVNAIVLSDLGDTDPTVNWSEGQWSDVRGWPTAVTLYDGRLWWAGHDKLNGSVSDSYGNFDDLTIGDSGPISRSIGYGPVDRINWLLPLQRLLIGSAGAEVSLRSTSFDEPLTPTNNSLKDASTQGSAEVAAIKIDMNGVFVQKSGRRVFLLNYNWTLNSVDYTSSDLTIFDPDLGIDSAFTRLAVQRQPDTRIHALRDDGTVAVLVFNPAEDLQCWVEVEVGVAVGAVIEDIIVLPDTIEDAVYYVVHIPANEDAQFPGGGFFNRPNSRFLCRWAREDQCRGATDTRLADMHILYNGAPTSTLTLAHLPNEQIVVWADGKDKGTFTANGSGVVTLPHPVSVACAGLGYDGDYQSTKLAYASQMGTALTQRKRVAELGLILADTHAQGLQAGPSSDRLDNLPLVQAGAAVDPDSVYLAYDYDMTEFPAEWSTDSRIYLKATAPRPVTVLAAVIGMETIG